MPAANSSIKILATKAVVFSSLQPGGLVLHPASKKMAVVAQVRVLMMFIGVVGQANLVLEIEEVKASTVEVYTFIKAGSA